LSVDNSGCSPQHKAMRTLLENIKFTCTSFRNRCKSWTLMSFSCVFRCDYQLLFYFPTM